MSRLYSKEVIRCVRQAFSEEFESHWVLFANGTVVKLPRTCEDVWGEAADTLRKHQLAFFDDFTVHKLSGVEGWLVEIKENALYVYVHPNEIEQIEMNGLELGIMGKEKFILDTQKPQPIYVHLQAAAND